MAQALVRIPSVNPPGEHHREIAKPGVFAA